MPITPPPPTPSRTNPLTFSPRMDATLAWFPTFVTDYNNDAALMGRRYVTYGGTANAITLTGALPAGASSIPVGTQVRFRATAANTGSSTINLDGVGAVACRTITGVDLPSGYIRTGVDTVASFDGTYWVLDRQIERGSNANGDYTRFADGNQICIHSITGSATTTAAGSIFTSGDDSWTFPAAFVSTTGLALAATSNFAGRWINVYAATTTTATIRQFNATSNASTPTLRVLAIGRWY
jgi:hypothetical protein